MISIYLYAKVMARVAERYIDTWLALSSYLVNIAAQPCIDMS